MIGLFFLGMIVSVITMWVILNAMSKEGKESNGDEKRL